MRDKFDCLSGFGFEELDSTKERFLCDWDFYYGIVLEALNDKGFDEMRKQLVEKNYKSAFDTAHMLKGIISNCGITPLYNLILLIVEPLRACEGKVIDQDGLINITDKIITERDLLVNKFIKLID